MLDPARLRQTALLYADDDQLSDPHVSPLYGDASGLPPVLAQVSSAEILLDDTMRFADRARRSGVEVTVQIEDHVPHVWHLFAGTLDEADRALLRIGRWADRLLDRR